MQQKYRSWIYIIVTSTIVMASGVLWFLGKTTFIFWEDKISLMTAAGQLAALFGIILYALTIIFNKRISLLYNGYGSIGKACVFHHWLGTITLVLLLSHPLMSVFKYLYSSPRQAAELFIPGINWQTTWGVFSLALMILTAVVMYFFTVSGKVWKSYHTIIELAFIPAFIHFLLISSDVTTNHALRLYIMIIASLALISIFYGLMLRLINDITHHKDSPTC
ncbi:hypothetical protein HGB13_01925 [bacterium]|nr:hypothetical protein [bacterium]